MQLTRLILPVLLAGAAASLAAAPAPEGQPAPLDPAAAASPLVYDSAFAGYKAYQEPKVANWKETNAAIATVPGHGGHGAHAGHDMSEMQPAGQPEPKTGPAEPAKSDPHAGHQHE